MALTGKTIGQLTLLETPTVDTLIPVELSGETYHIEFSAITSNSTVEVTYSELVDKITGETLNTGSYYIITDYKTCYDQPDYDYNQTAITSGNYKDNAPVEPIIVFATSSNTISDIAYQPVYPNDRIKYDWTFSTTEVTSGVAYGRISERIDEFNNRTDYDHRQIQFKRYKYWEVDLSNPYQGTVEVIINSATEMSVSGVGTNFTSLSVGNKIGFNFDSSFKVYEVTNIDSDTGIIITGLTNTSSGPGAKMYTAFDQGYVSYYQNNLETNNFQENYTFDYENYPYFNNYVGNFSNTYNLNGENFILANNVFKGGTFRNNKFENNCFNNTFDDDCTQNTVENYFYGNITNDDFDGNVIGNWFRNNKITSNFQYNRIGENFENNYLVQNDFYRNNIMNYFQQNKISGSDFQNNEIGSQFGNNILNCQFYKNDIGNGYNNNEVYADFYGNLLGNGFNGNNIYCQFYDNKIGEIFANNNLGDSTNFGIYGFYKNDIGSDFYSNTCFGTFAYNRIGSNFYSNTIGDGFGYGVSTSQGNVIGNYFYSNTIGEYFYNNTISDGFFNNNIFDYFQTNNVKIPFLNGIDFTFYYGNITAFTYTATGSSATDGIYTNLTGDTNNLGVNADFTIEVSGNAVIGVSGDTLGKYYEINDTITILGSLIGGTDVDDDVVITVTAISPTPTVYESYNCELFINSGNINRLSFYDGSDILNIKDIND